MMKAIKNYIWIVALTISVSTLIACSNEDESYMAKNDAKKTHVVTLVTTLSPMNCTAMRTTTTESSGTLELGWEVGDFIWVNYTNTSNLDVEAQATVTAVDGSGNATINVELVNPKMGNSEIMFGFPYNHWHNGLDPHANQVGTLTDIIANHAVSSGSGTLYVSGGTATLPAGITMTPEICIWKLSFSDGTSNITSSITKLCICFGEYDEYVITPSSQDNIYVALNGDTNPKNISITATTSSGTYRRSKNSITLNAGKIYNTTNLTLVNCVPLANASVSNRGQVIAADGFIYLTVSDATAAGTTASGLLTYIGTPGNIDESSSSYKGLALALSDANNGSPCMYYTTPYNTEPCVSRANESATAITYKNGIVSTSTLISDGHTHAAATAASNYGTARPSGVSQWFLPSLGQWNLIAQGLASIKYNNATIERNINSCEGFIGHYTSTFLNSVLTNVGGTALQTGQGAQYWSCTECPMGSAWTMYFYQGTSYSSVNTEPHYVRPVFAF